MTIRVFFVPFQLHIFLTTFIVMTTPFKEDFLPRLITLKVQRLEYNESNFQNLNCSSTRQSFGKGAEFMVNGRTVEHISFHDNICYNSKREECTIDNCQCFPNDNIYIYNYENKEHTAELTLGCQMRFADNITSNIFQVITSVKINGSAMDKYEYDIKILKENKEESTTIDDKKTNSSFVDISLWLPITCGVLFIVFIVLTVSIYCFRSRN